MAIAPPADADGDQAGGSSLPNRWIDRSLWKDLKSLVPASLVARRVISTGPMGPCSADGCDSVRRWKDCREERTVGRERGGVHDNDEGVRSYMGCYCNRCMAVVRDTTSEVALARIRDEKPHMKKRKALQATQNGADPSVAADVPCRLWGQRGLAAAGPTGNAIPPLAKFIDLMAMTLRARGHLLGPRAELAGCRQQGEDMEDAPAHMPGLDRLESRADGATAPLAIANKSADQWALCLAAGCPDEWTVIRGPDGVIKHALRAFCRCGSGGETGPCCTVTIGLTPDLREWRRFVSAPSAVRQRWYCRTCYARYKTRFGVLLELRDELQNVYWISCDLPGVRNDGTWLAAGAARWATSPRELPNMMDEIHPYAGDGFLRSATPSECLGGDNTGVYKVVDLQAYRAMPVWPWSSFLAFSKALGSSSSAAAT